MNSLDVTRASGLIGYRELVESHGGNSREILLSVGLDPNLLDDPNQFFPLKKKFLAIEAAAYRLGIRDFGMLLSRTQGMSFLGSLFFALQSAGSVSEGLKFASRHMNYQTPGIAILFSDSDDGKHEAIHFKFPLEGLPPVHQSMEHVVAHASNSVSVLSNGKLGPEEIHFRHAAISEPEAYREYFGQLPVFNSSFDGIVLNAQQSMQPIPNRNRILDEFAESFMFDVAPPEELSINLRVAHALKSLMPIGPCDINSVSKLLRLHPRTLQRRLKKLDLSFQELHDSVRRQLAYDMISETTVALSHVAFILGYSDQTAFTRACRRWFGDSPKSIRDKHRQFVA